MGRATGWDGAGGDGRVANGRFRWRLCQGGADGRRFYIYAERGLANQRVSIWIHQGKLHVEHQNTLLAHYACKLNRKSKTLKSVTEPQLYQTPFASAQLELFDLDETQWQKIYHRPPCKHHPKGGQWLNNCHYLVYFACYFFGSWQFLEKGFLVVTNFQKYL